MIEKKELNQNDFAGRRLLSTQEAARFLNLSVRTVYNRICRRSKNPFPFRVKRLGRLRKFDIQDLQGFVDSL
jgi:excisionase family DNA binding protein